MPTTTPGPRTRPKTWPREAPADLQIVDDELHVRINALSASRRSRAIAGLCADLNSSDTVYPGTQLVLRFGVKEP